MSRCVRQQNQRFGDVFFRIRVAQPQQLVVRHFIQGFKIVGTIGEIGLHQIGMLFRRNNGGNFLSYAGFLIGGFFGGQRLYGEAQEKKD